MTFYIATKFALGATVVQDVKRRLEAIGHSVPYDWSLFQNDEKADLDVKGVEDAYALIGLFEDEHKYKGALIEVGIAIAHRKPIYIVGNWLDSCIFMRLKNVTKFKTADELISFLTEPRTAKGSLD